MMEDPGEEGIRPDMPNFFKAEDRWHQYRLALIVELRPYEPGEDMKDIKVFPQDAAQGYPKEGDYIARDPTQPEKQWLMSAEHVGINYRRL